MAFEVSLALYDLSNGMALQMSRQFALLEGRTIEMIPHTGVRLHGKEYFFGGGVQALPPATVERTFGRKPVRIERLGTTDRTAADIATWLRDTARQWSPESYDLWRHNCNDFSQALTRFLLGARATIPAWILTLPAEVLATPLGKLLEPGLGAFQEEFNGNLRLQGGALEGGGPAAPDAPAAGALNVTVKAAAEGSAQPRRVALAADATVGDLRRALGVDGAPRFVFLGKMLSDDAKPLAAYGVCDAHQILILGAKRADAPAPAATPQAAARPAAAARTPLEAAVARVEAAGGPAVLAMLSKVCSNVIEHPTEDKYQVLKLSNAAFQRKVAAHAGALDVLKLAGFLPDLEVLRLTPSASAWGPLTAARALLDARIAALAAPPPAPRDADPFAAILGGLGGPGGLGAPGGPGDGGDFGGLAQQMPGMSAMLGNPAMMAQMRETLADPAQMRRVAELMHRNPGLQQAALQHLGQSNPQMQLLLNSHPQARQQMEQLFADPAALTQLMEQMQRSPLLGGAPGAGAPPPDFERMVNSLGRTPAGLLPAPGQPAATSPGAAPDAANGAMSEEDALLEAIRRSMSEQ